MTSDGTDLEVVSPHTGAVERTRRPTTVNELEGTIAAARAAQRTWSRRPMRARRDVLLAVADHLLAHADAIASVLHHVNGKPVAEAVLAEVYPTIATFRWFAQHAGRHLGPRRIPVAAVPLAHSVLHFDPLGVVAVIAPWNYPFKIALQDVPAALMAGNTVVIKASEHAVAAGELVEHTLADAGLPEGLVQVVYGRGDLGEALIGSGVDKVVFTGSTATGRAVYAAAARALIPCTLEMGGKDTAFVLEDADIDDAARGILWAGLCNNGQTCASVEIVRVARPAAAALEAAFARLLPALPPQWRGRMNVAFQAATVDAHVSQALAAGARVVAGAPGAGNDPFARDPIVLADVPSDCDVLQRETFGPVLCVQPFDDLDTAIDATNASPYGLTASIWSRDRRRAEHLAERLDTGVVTINEHLLTGGMPEAPWLGHKESGLGLSLSHLSLQAFSKVRYVFHDRGLVRYKFWRYPYTEDKAAWMRQFLRAQCHRSVWTRLWSSLCLLPRLLLRRNEDYSPTAAGSKDVNGTEA